MSESGGDEKEMIELKPCPFCGGIPELKHKVGVANKSTGSYIRCNSCETETKVFPVSPEWSSDEKAAETWNRRTDPEIRIAEDGITFSGMTVSSGSGIDADI